MPGRGAGAVAGAEPVPLLGGGVVDVPGVGAAPLGGVVVPGFGTGCFVFGGVTFGGVVVPASGVFVFGIGVGVVVGGGTTGAAAGGQGGQSGTTTVPWHPPWHELRFRSRAKSPIRPPSHPLFRPPNAGASGPPVMADIRTRLYMTFLPRPPGRAGPRRGDRSGRDQDSPIGHFLYGEFRSKFAEPVPPAGTSNVSVVFALYSSGTSALRNTFFASSGELDSPSPSPA